MATYCGKDGTVEIGTDTIAEIRDFSVEATAETQDSTTMDNGSGYRTHKHTWKTWSGSVNCFWDPTDNNGQGALLVGANVALNFYTEGDGSGATYYNGSATVTSITRNAAVDGLVEASFSFQGNGALNTSTVA